MSLSKNQDKNGCDRKWLIPSYQTPYLDQWCLFADDPDEMEQIKQFWLQYCMLPRQYFEKRIWPSTIQFASYTYPNCLTMDKFITCVKWVCYFWVLDDHAETDKGEFKRDTQKAYLILNQYKRAIDRLEALYINGVKADNKPLISMCDWKPYVLCVYAFIENIMLDMNVDERRRLLHSWRRYMTGQHQENVLIEKQTLMDYHELMEKVRIPASGVEPVMALITYSTNLTVPESEWSDPMIEQLRRLCNICTVYIGDIYSFEKELYEEKGDFNCIYFNWVAYNVVHDQMKPEHAIQKCLDDNYKLEAEFNKLSDEVCEMDRFSTDTKQFVRYLKNVMASCYYISVKADRFNLIYDQ